MKPPKTIRLIIIAKIVDHIVGSGFIFLQHKYRSKIHYTSKPSIAVAHKSTSTWNGSMLYETIYQKKYETEPRKYAQSNYRGDNSPAYFGRKQKQ